MRIDLQDLATSRLALTLPGDDGQERSLVAQDIQGLRGTVETTAERITISGARAQSAHIAGLDWPAPSAHVVASEPVEIGALALDLDIDRTGDKRLSGRLTAQRIGRARMAVNLATGDTSYRISGIVAGHSVDLSREPGSQNGSAADLSVDELQTVLAGFLVKMTDAVLHGVTGSSAVDSTIARADRVAAAQVSASNQCALFDVRGIALDGGLDWADGVLRVPTLAVAGVDISITDVRALSGECADTDSERAGLDASDAAAGADAMGDHSRSADQRGWRSLIDLSQLDRLNGTCAVDVTADISLPVIGRRVATHEFRVPIADGVINFRQLERGLSALEDAVIDFEIKGKTLVLERDIPLIGMEMDLVRWPLPTERDRSLASKKNVRLSVLATPEQRPGAPSRSGDKTDASRSSVTINRVCLDAFHLDISAVRKDDASVAEGGAITDLAVARLQVRGALCAATRHTPAAAKRDGELSLEIESLSATLRDLDLGSFVVEHAQLTVDRVENATVGFSGPSVRDLSGSAHGIVISDLVIRAKPPAKASAAD